MKAYNIVNTNMEYWLSQSRISQRLAIEKSKQMDKILNSELEYLLTNEDAAKFLLFEENWFNKLLNQLLTSEDTEAEQQSDWRRVGDGSNQSEASAERQEETKEIEKNDSDNQKIPLIQDNTFEYDLKSFLQGLCSASAELSNLSILSQEESQVCENTDKQTNVIASDNASISDYARTMIWNKSNIPKEKDLAPNTDWCCNKKGYRQRIISHPYQPEHNDVIWIQFKLSRVVWIQEIQVGFTNFWTSDSHIYIEPSTVVVEVGMTEDEALSTCVLTKIDDKGLSNFGVTAYGACWNSFNTKSKSDDIETLVQAQFDSLKLLKGRYVTFMIQNNSVTWLENSPMIAKCNKPKWLGISYFSIMGHEQVDCKMPHSTALLPTLSFLFKRNFKETQKLIVERSNEFNFNENFNKLLSVLSDRKYSTLIRNIFKMYASKSQEVSDQIILNLLNLEAKMIDEQLLWELISQDADLFDQRMGTLSALILDSLPTEDMLASKASVNIDKLRVLMSIFETLAANNLRGSNYNYMQKPCLEDNKKWLNTDIDSIKRLLNLLDNVEGDPEFVLKLLALLLPRTTIKGPSGTDCQFVDRVTVVKELLLWDHTKHRRVELASFLISNLTIKQESNEYYSAMAPIINCKTIISKLKAFALDISLNENPDTTEIIYLLQIFENLLLNSTFLKNYQNNDNESDTSAPFIAEELNAVLAEICSKSHIMNLQKCNNVLEEVQKLIINIIAKITIGFKDKEDILVKQLIDNLWQLKDSNDAEYVNSVLAPLLKAEYRVPVSFSFRDPTDNSLLTFKAASERWLESQRQISFLSRPELARVVDFWGKVLDSSFNRSKVFSARWQNIYTFTGTKIGIPDLKNMIAKMLGKTSFIIIIEGQSKQGVKCIFGAFNRNALRLENGKYKMSASADNLYFWVTGIKTYSFSLETGLESIRIDTSGDVHTLELAGGFIRLEFPNENPFQFGQVNLPWSSRTQSEPYQPVSDFRLDKIEILQIGGVQSPKDEQVQDADSPNLILQLKSTLESMFEIPRALRVFRDNWFLGKRYSQ